MTNSSPSPLTGAEPQPTECWGLYDDEGILTIATPQGYSMADQRDYAAMGWTIHRVRVEPVGVK